MQQVLLKTLEALRNARLREADKLVHFVLGTCRMTVLDMRRTSRRQEELLTIYEEWTIGADGLIAKSKGHYDEAEYKRQLKSGGGE